jgi:hypothetical protein
VIQAPQAFCLALAIFGAGVPLANAAPQDALIRREALSGDQRLFDNFRAFALALRGATGGEPKLSRLEVSENTGAALVRQDDGRVRSFSFVEGQLSERRVSLRDEAPADQALARRFTFDAVDLDKVRGALKAQRAQPGHGGDSAPTLSVGYRAIAGRSLVSIEVGSMAINGLDLVSYDLATGEAVDLKGMLAKANAEVAEHNRRVEARIKAQERRDAEEQARLSKIDMFSFGGDAVAALQQNAGLGLRLRNVVLMNEEIHLTFADARTGEGLVTYRYDRRKMLDRLDSRETEITRCEQPFSPDEFEWSRVPELVQRSFDTLQFERDAHVRVDVERANRCGPPRAQVSLSKNGRVLSAFFDQSGRLYHVE